MGATQAIKDFWRDFPTWLPDGCQPDAHHQGSSHLPAARPARRRDPTRLASAESGNGSPAQGVRIRFIGVWDTVAMDFRSRKWRISGTGSSILTVSPTRISAALSIMPATRCRSMTNVRHLRILWEGRRPPTPGQDGPPPVDPRIEQVWFAGVHANVGGGYPSTAWPWSPSIG